MKITASYITLLIELKESVTKKDLSLK